METEIRVLAVGRRKDMLFGANAYLHEDDDNLVIGAVDFEFPYLSGVNEEVFDFYLIFSSEGCRGESRISVVENFEKQKSTHADCEYTLYATKYGNLSLRYRRTVEKKDLNSSGLI